MTSSTGNNLQQCAVPEGQELQVMAGAASSKKRVLLSVRELYKRFGGQVVLDGIDVTLHEGDIVLLRGENGSGKTTLLNILTGNLEPDAGRIAYAADETPRAYIFPRRWWEDLNPFDHFTPEFVAREGIARTWQDVRLFDGMSLQENVAVAASSPAHESPLSNLLFPGKAEITEQVLMRVASELLAQLGLEGRDSSSADRISLGQTKRVAIARAVVSGAKVLFLDEPLAGLDGAGISSVVEFLHELSASGITLVLVEHMLNLRHLEDLITVDWVLEGGKLMCRSRVHSMPSSDDEHHFGSVFDNPLTGLLAESGHRVVEDRMVAGARLTRLRKGDAAEPGVQPILQVDELRVERGPRLIDWKTAAQDKGLSLEAYPGDVVLLQAPNGWGKTSLLEAIAGLALTKTGFVKLDGQVLNGMSTDERSRFGVCLTKADKNVFPSLTGREYLTLAGASVDGLDDLDYLGRPIADYSGGQRQFLALLGARRQTVPKISLFDEPFSMLDKQAVDRISPLFHAATDVAILISLPLAAEL